jgi:hypothetical protein
MTFEHVNFFVSLDEPGDQWLVVAVPKAID